MIDGAVWVSGVLTDFLPVSDREVLKSDMYQGFICLSVQFDLSVLCVSCHSSVSEFVWRAGMSSHHSDLFITAEPDSFPVLFPGSFDMQKAPPALSKTCSVSLCMFM